MALQINVDFSNLGKSAEKCLLLTLTKLVTISNVGFVVRKGFEIKRITISKNVLSVIYTF